MTDAGKEIERLLEMLARLPGLGPRSARRVVLHLVKKREAVLDPLSRALTDVAASVRTCESCGNIGTREVCTICTDARRDTKTLCIVEDVSDLWAIERAAIFKGRYFVLGGVLSALDGVGPEDLGLPALLKKVADDHVSEVILALNATVDGQTTAHYIADRFAGRGVSVSSLAQGIPIGGELDYLDDGTIIAALNARKSLS